MIDRVLVAMDDSELSERALVYALNSHPNAEITVIHVVGEPSPMMGKATDLALADDIEAAAEEHAEAVFDRAQQLAAEYDHELKTVTGWGSPGKVIVNRSKDYDTVVIGSHSGTLVDRLFVGNVTEAVFHRAPVPVTVVR